MKEDEEIGWLSYIFGLVVSLKYIYVGQGPCSPSHTANIRESLAVRVFRQVCTILPTD